MPAKVRAGRVTLSDANPPIRTGEFGHRPLHRESSRGSVNDGDTSGLVPRHDARIVLSPEVQMQTTHTYITGRPSTAFVRAPMHRPEP
jgi:hypothetical protein